MHTARARLRRFSRRAGVSEEHLGLLRALYVRPALQSLSHVLRSLYLDRVLSMLLACACVAVAGLMGHYQGLWVGALTSIPAAILGIYTCVGSGTNTLPTARMQSGAAHIAKLFRARWVIMGHTHDPEVTPVAEGSSYVNLGSWGEDDPPDERKAVHKSSCTYLVIRHQDGDYRGELLHWDTARGAEPYKRAS